MRVRKILVVAAALGLAASPTVAAPYYLKVANRSLFGVSAFGPDGGELRLPRGFQDHQLQVFGTFRLSEDWILVGQAVPVGVGVYGEDAQPYFGGLGAGIRRRLTGGPFSVWLEAELGARPSSPTLFQGVVGSVPVRVKPVVGTFYGGGQLRVEAPFSWGWAAMSGGARGFSNPRLEPALLGFAQIGLVPTRGLALDLHLSGWYAFGDLEPVDVLGSGQTRYLGLGVGAEWWAFSRAALTLGVDVGPIAQANAVSPSLSLGVALR